MLMTKPFSRPVMPVRAMSPHSMTMTASPGSATWSTTSISGTPGNTSIGGGAGSLLTTRASLPMARSAYAIANADPMASPSGRACEVITNRCLPRISAAICASGVVSVVVIIGVVRRDVDRRVRRLGRVLVQVADDLLDPILVRDRVVEAELDLGRAPEP